MAGTIHISDSLVWSAGTIAFETIADVTRGRFTDSERDSVPEVYAPLDQGFGFIAIDELNLNAYRLFCRRCDEAYQECVERNNCPNVPQEFYEGVMECWREFLDLMSKDDRFDSQQFP
jgi:hypothetical protein